jgi:hypothetical protein
LEDARAGRLAKRLPAKGEPPCNSERKPADSPSSFPPPREIARFGLSVGAVQDVVISAIGGENVTATVEGRARFPVNVRYPRDLRSDLETLGRVLVITPSGAQVPLAQVADIRTVTGPSMIRNENGLLVGYVYGDITGREVGGCGEPLLFHLPSSKRIDGVGTWALEFKETHRPTLVMKRDGTDVPCEGTIWVNPADGTVVRTRLRLRNFANLSYMSGGDPGWGAGAPVAE